jgi:hypothetical protein
MELAIECVAALRWREARTADADGHQRRVNVLRARRHVGAAVRRDARGSARAGVFDGPDGRRAAGSVCARREYAVEMFGLEADFLDLTGPATDVRHSRSRGA